ncbi:hypothetical protein EG68_03505 [Paragonimus skrjabini miyazakii]|uniref:Uncharacterized protein n=1 Tax=Paragonimus skrjabini miyazakii TaxID=59628 RepID=A0A8S9Z8G7_9TREM|nr:hypothetical protein EG68_03505 [Paragonimus skrjabini miyazakii]
MVYTIYFCGNIPLSGLDGMHNASAVNRTLREETAVRLQHLCRRFTVYHFAIHININYLQTTAASTV